MANAVDVAQYIIENTPGEMTAMKLQKLVYYAQAWSLVWDDEPLFDEEIQAWAMGPVIPALYDIHRGLYKVNPYTFKGNTDNLTDNQKDSINIIIANLGKFNSYELSRMTHMEAPWLDAREGIPDGVRSSSVISHASMAEFYGAMIAD